MPIAFLLVLLHLYIGVRLLPSLGGLPGGLVAVALAASVVLIPAAFLGRRARSRRTADRWSWAGMIALGGFSMALVLTLLRDLLLALSHGFGGPALAEPTAAAVPVLTLAAVLVGAWRARRTPPVKDVTVPIAGLPPALDGFTIAQISDVHVGPTVKAPFVQAVVDRINELGVDAVAITGDLVDGRVDDLLGDVAPLAGLRSRHGTWFVTGNHEYYSGASEWISALRRLGIGVLLDEHVVLDRDGAPLVLAGITDHGSRHFDPAHRSDPRAALRGAPPQAVKVLLAHQPRSAAAAADAGFDLQLSGHTHGGQFWPWNLFVPLQQPFVAGLHRQGRMWVYTSRGTGYWGPPLRFGAPSEITRVRLRSAMAVHRAADPVNAPATPS